MPLLAAFMFIISGCGEGEGEGPSSGASESAATAAPVEPELPSVEIDFTEYEILMDARVPAGPVILRIANRGFEEHNLILVRVESDSTIWETERRLNPGERRAITITFEAGEYRAICDFSGHEGRGMVVDFLAQEKTPSGAGAG